MKIDGDIPHETESILVAIGGALQDIDRETIRRFLKYSEFELALDTLCEQICERNVVLGGAVYERIMTLLSSAGMDQAHYRAMIPSPKE